MGTGEERGNKRLMKGAKILNVYLLYLYSIYLYSLQINYINIYYIFISI